MNKFFLGFKWLQFVFASGAFVGAFVGSVGGFGAGYLAGVLNAPKEGKETRDEIANKIDRFIGAAKVKVDEYSKAIQESADEEELKSSSSDLT